jgi:hypothetical protein
LCGRPSGSRIVGSSVPMFPGIGIGWESGQPDVASPRDIIVAKPYASSSFGWQKISMSQCGFPFSAALEFF